MTLQQKRPLGIVKEIVEESGLTITYAYDDLVFISNNPFLIKFDDEKENHLKLFFNKNCEADAAAELEQKLKKASIDRDMTITNCGRYALKQKEESEEIEISFFQR